MPEYPRDVAEKMMKALSDRGLVRQGGVTDELRMTAYLAEVIHAYSTRYAHAAALDVRQQAAVIARNFSLSGEPPPSKPGGRRWQLAERIEQIPLPGDST